MMKKIKLLLVVLMTCLTVCLTMPNTKVEAASKMTLAQLRAKFPHGKYWNHIGSKYNNPDGWTNTPCTHHGYKGSGCSYTGSCGCNNVGDGHDAIQCMGYAYKLGLDAYGTNPYYWKVYTGSSARNYLYNKLKPGDVVRINNNGHSIFITGVSGNTVTYTDCNAGATCVIRWGKTMSKATLASKLTNIREAPGSMSIYGMTVSYDNNGGTGSIKAHSIAYENSFTVSSSTAIKKTGYTLEGYYLYRNGDKKYYTVNQGWQDEATITSKGYEIKLYKGKDKITLDKTLTDKPSSLNKFTLVAKWKSNTFNIEFDSNEGIGVMDSMKVTYGIETPLSSSIFTKEGYNFGGWNAYCTSTDKWLYVLDGKKQWYKEGSEPKGYIKYVFGQNEMVSDLSGVDQDIIRMSVVWKPNTFTVSFVKNNEEGYMSDVLVNYGSSMILPENTFINKGYEFVGWNVYSVKHNKWIHVEEEKMHLHTHQDTVINCSPLLVKPGDDISTITSLSDDIVHLVPVWHRIEGFHADFTFGFINNMFNQILDTKNQALKNVKETITYIIGNTFIKD